MEIKQLINVKSDNRAFRSIYNTSFTYVIIKRLTVGMRGRELTFNMCRDKDARVDRRRL